MAIVFYNILKDIKQSKGLSKVLYETQEEFYCEEIGYREINTTKAQSFQIKKHLHEILTNAIFSYCPCNALLDLLKINKPTSDAWKNCVPKWLGLNAEPFTQVS